MSNTYRIFNLSIITFCLAALCILSTLAFATDKIKLNAASTALLQQCTSCHSKDLSGNLNLQAPALAGQAAWYITQQFTHFKQGIRGQHPKDVAGQQMAVIAQGISVDEDLQQLAQYIETLPANINESAQDASVDLRQGSNYYQGKCGACHGGNAQGNESLHAPRLNSLTTQYLAQQMSNFTKGLRGTDAQDKYGRQMAMMAKMTSGQELKNILAFIATKRLTVNED